MSSRHRILALLIAVAGACSALAQQVPNRELPLQVEAKIPLGDVRGRIDHLAVDLARKRLFIAELGNDSLAVVDLAAGTVARRVNSLREPQAVAYAPGADAVLVANARDGGRNLLSDRHLRVAVLSTLLRRGPACGALRAGQHDGVHAPALQRVPDPGRLRADAPPRGGAARAA